MKSIFYDLTLEKQKELIEVMGDTGKYEVFPIVTLEFEERNEDGTDQYGKLK